MHKLPEPTKVSTFSYETVSDMPEQTEADIEPFEIKNPDGVFEVDPLYNYKMTAMVMSRYNYDWEWDGRLVPVDLALAWGDLTKPELMSEVSYSQSGRWYYYRYSGKFPRDPSYIITHSANNHLVPASQNIREALQKVQTHQIVHLEGYLINISGNVGGRKITWTTSQTRNDSGDHSCELFYVNKLVIGKNIYI